MLRLFGVVTMLPVLILGGGFVGGLFAYGPTPEDPGAPSSLVTVIAIWEEEGDELCRAFMYQDLLPRLDTLRVRFALTPAEIENCRADFAAYESKEGWPRKLVEDELRYPDYWFEVEDEEPLELMVHRSSGDATWANTRYRVDAAGSITDMSTNTASAGQGIGLVMGGLVGLVAWLLWTVWLALRTWRRRKGGPVTLLAVLLTSVLFPAASAAQSASRIEGSGGSPNVISSEQIRQSGLEGLSAWEIVERLRPRWFGNRGNSVLDNLQVTVARVVVNGMPLSSSSAPGLSYSSGNQLDDLRGLRGSEIDQMRYLDRRDATTRFGTGYESGAIVVELSRGRGSVRGPRTTAERARVEVQPGDRVRFRVDGSWSGVVQSSGSDSISLLVDEVAQEISFSWASVERLEVSSGVRSRRRGAVVGGGTGGALALWAAFYSVRAVLLNAGCLTNPPHGIGQKVRGASALPLWR